MTRRPLPFTWRGLEFVAGWFSDHSGELRYDSKDATWAVERFRTEGPWYARLRIGVHRFSGEGQSKVAALEAAHQEAARVHSRLTSELERTEQLTPPPVSGEANAP